MDLRYENQAAVEAKQGRRDQQRRTFSRNQAIGLLLAAAAILAYRLTHTPAAWIFPPGWWRIW